MNLHWHKHIHLFVKMVKKQHKSESLRKKFLQSELQYRSLCSFLPTSGTQKLSERYVVQITRNLQEYITSTSKLQVLHVARSHIKVV